jgi:hypothetical protein
MSPLPDLTPLIEKFHQWYVQDEHSKNEDAYADIITADKLEGLSEQEFKDFFYRFVADGGKVQSGGDRSKNPFLQKTLQQRAAAFRSFVLEPFQPGFSVSAWLNRIDEFPHFGKGTATIYLNRIDKSAFPILNQKTIQALSKMGYSFPSNLIEGYKQVEEAQRELIDRYPLLQNFFKADALNHYMIAVAEGQNICTKLFDTPAGKNSPLPRSIVKEESAQFSTSPLNTILYGPPGTGKTYNTILKAAQIVENRALDDYSQAQEIFKAHLGDRIEFITFHQNYSYEDFIQGLRPDVDNGSTLLFEKRDGVFKRIADRALKNLKDADNPRQAKLPFVEVLEQFFAPLNNGESVELEVKMKRVSYFITGVTTKSIEFRKADGDSAHTLSIETLRKMYDKGHNDIIKGGLQPYYNPLLHLFLELGRKAIVHVERHNYVIVIDEINRANISRVFGELITLIEPDKRSHGEHPLSCTLPSGEEFIVPSNLSIIGTMNTADKSIALLDIALRRRFEFEPMYPLYEIPNQTVHEPDILKRINAQIVKLKGHDFQIGHSYFMGSSFRLDEAMNKKVIPLLLEYFLNDEKEVRGILQNAGLTVIEGRWPLMIQSGQ